MAVTTLYDEQGNPVQVDLEDGYTPPEGDGSPASKAFIKQRQEIATLKAQLATSQREAVFGRSGVNMADPRVQDFIKAYDGDLDLAKVQEAAAARGYLVQVPDDQVDAQGNLIAQPTPAAPAVQQSSSGDLAVDMANAAAAQAAAQAIARAASGANPLQPPATGPQALVEAYSAAAAGGRKAAQAAVLRAAQEQGLTVVSQ